MDTGKLKTFRPDVVQLESREVPTVASITFANHILTVTTTNQDTNLVVQQDVNAVYIRDSVTGQVSTYNRAQFPIARVDVIGGDGNDTFMAVGNAGVFIRFLGKGGDDYLEGNAGNNFLAGGAGNDRIYGRGGDDTCIGAAGNDFIFGGAGNDTINGADGNDTLIGGNGSDAISGGAGDDVIVTIDGDVRDVADAGSGTDVLWTDQIGALQDSVTGIDGFDYIRAVSSFANGADLTLDGDKIADPALLSGNDAYESFEKRPMFASDGATIQDINQTRRANGAVVLNDSTLLASLGAMYQAYPNLINSNVVEFGDGTFGVRLNGSYYRVDNDLPVDTAGNVISFYAGVGIQNSLWVAIIEKAVATQANVGNPSYQLINGTLLPSAAFRLFGAPSTGLVTLAIPGALVDSFQVGSVLDNLMSRNFPTVITVNTVPGGVSLIAGQTYTVTGLLYDNQGIVTDVIMRNPTGVDGVGNDANPLDGFVTIDIDDLFSITGTLYAADFSTV
jgi:hypothetical protein